MTVRAELDGRPVVLEVRPDALHIDGEPFAWVDMDHVEVEGWSVSLRGPGRDLTLHQLGRQRDDFVAAVRAARLPARRAAMLQSGSSSPLASFDAVCDGQPVFVGLHTDGLTVEADSGNPVYLPLSLVTSIERDGYRITIRSRSSDDVILTHTGRRTDELLTSLDRARRDLADATRAAYRDLDPALEALPAPDGWALDRHEAGEHWPPLRSAFERADRSDEIDTLDDLAGEALRLGIKAGFAGETMTFALAPCGDRVAVESAGGEARATFVFATDDVDHLNVALLVTSFRREALFLPEAELGRWAVAVRQLEVVRWARAALVARVVHDARWTDQVRAALQRS